MNAHFLISITKAFMPYIHIIYACWQPLDAKSAVRIAQGKMRAIGHDDSSAHPGVEHVAVDSNHTGVVEPFFDFTPLG